MPRPLPVPVRQAIWRRSQEGQVGPTVARALGLAPRTVRRLVHRFHQGGEATLIPSYDRCGVATPKPSESVMQTAVGLRREQPTWGAGLIGVMQPSHPLRGFPGNRALDIGRLAHVTS
jgi:hypothetical protein